MRTFRENEAGRKLGRSGGNRHARGQITRLGEETRPPTEAGPPLTITAFEPLSPAPLEDRVPGRGVARGGSPRSPAGPDRSSCQLAGRLTIGIIAQGRDGFQRHVAGALDRPFIVLLEQDRADETDDGVLVGEDADDLGAPLDLAVEAFDRVGRVQLGAMLRPGRSYRRGHRPRPRPGRWRAWAAWDAADRRPCAIEFWRPGVVLGERCGDEGGDDTRPILPA